MRKASQYSQPSYLNGEEFIKVFYLLYDVVARWASC
jgi:hypothetical protein